MFLKKYQSCTNTLNILNGMDVSLLPPCQFAIDMYIRTVNSQVCVWIHSHGTKQGLSNSYKSRRKINGEDIEYDRVKGNLRVPEKLINILCEQNVDGDADHDDDDDDDDDDNDECFEMTNMVDEVFEDQSDEH